MLWRQLARRTAVDGLGIELGPEAQRQVGPPGHLNGQPHLRGGLPDRPNQPSRVNADLWRLVVSARPVEPDQGMEVHHATTLEFRDLHK